MELVPLETFSQLRGNFGPAKELREIFGPRGDGSLPSLQGVVCLVLGPSGTGKSALEHILAQSSEVLCITDRTANVEGTIRNFVSHRTIETMLLTGKPQRKLVMMDDVDALLAVEKNACSIIQKYKASAGFLCTAVLSEERKLSNVKKIATHTVRLSRMSPADCFLRVQELVPELDIDDDELMALVKRHDCNLRLVKQYVDAWLTSGRSASAKSDVSMVFNASIYDQTERLMKEAVDDALVWAVVLKDACLVSMLMHENALNVSASRRSKADTQAYLRMYDAICDSDCFERAMFGKTNVLGRGDSGMDLMEFRKLRILNRHLSGMRKTSAKTKFTQYFTKLSLQSTMRRRMEDTFGASDGIVWLEFLALCHKACVDTKVASIVDDRVTLDLIKRFQKDFEA